MNEYSAAGKRQPVRFERTYDGHVDDLWDLWTTKDGFEPARAVSTRRKKLSG